MRRRAWSFRVLGLVCLGAALVIGALGVAAFPYPDNAFLSRKGVGDNTEASQYYAAISAPSTFAGWLSTYFAAGGLRADAIYYNAGDLGFGREMHCREEFAFTSCYVVNHGLGPGAPPDLAVNDAVANARILPTVAMVYFYGSGTRSPNDVRFYIYDAAGNLIPSVGLDSEGDKAAPQLCLPCHGGTYNAATNEVSLANFLPFDAPSFAYSTAPGYTRADQEEELRNLNRMVRVTDFDANILGLIDGWYADTGGVGTPGAVLDDDYTPAAYDGNAADRELYHLVVKPYCRACHIAQGFNLATPADVDTNAFYSVFDANDMPHAQVTAHNFWTSAAPAVLARRFPETLRVTNLADTTPNGCDANCTLREAVLAANADPGLSVIVFDVNGTWTLARAGADDTASLGDLDITADLYILGNGPLLTDLNGNATDRIFHILNGAEVVIQGVTVRNGFAPVGGGIRNVGSTLTLNLSVVRGNYASVSGGGGLSNEANAYAVINQSTINNNPSAGNGGGLFNDVSVLFVNNSTLSGNSSDATGGGLWSDFGAAATLRHVTVVGNQAATTGGGLATNNGSLTTVINSLVGGNTSGGLTDCFVSGDADQDSEGRNLFGASGAAGGCALGGSDLLNGLALGAVVDPALTIDPATGLRYHAPRPGSPLLDAVALGASCQTPSYDLLNVPRPRDANHDGALGCDIGAVEIELLAVFLPLVVR